MSWLFSPASPLKSWFLNVVRTLRCLWEVTRLIHWVTRSQRMQSHAQICCILRSSVQSPDMLAKPRVWLILDNSPPLQQIPIESCSKASQRCLQHYVHWCEHEARCSDSLASLLCWPMFYYYEYSYILRTCIAYIDDREVPFNHT